MENIKENSGAGDKDFSENPNPNSSFNSAGEADGGTAPEMVPRTPSRTPFTSLSQLDADLALARALQEQERAFMLLRMDGIDGSDYVSSDGGRYEEEKLDVDHELIDDEEGSLEGSDYGEDVFNANGSDINSADFENDEVYARAVQDVEERGIAVRLMALAGLNDWGIVEHGDRGNHHQDAWQEFDPDELSYEELVALGEVVGTQSRGLSIDTIASLPSFSYKAEDGEDNNSDQCVICRLDYADGDTLVMLSCKHNYHTECINNWLQINKVCPVCSAEVSSSRDQNV
ncbi:E3 ubiquitin ligase BIG BROTHER-related-like [Phalaenopsis equestris]|uniref:E3 ubiquitin ligase BIG BROTHER-related-like n=1 Tax=Phalaenopsis equestris TaxID=78828 RepID=UPI0009E5D944|nr:E3 ubiquitin ligase BIG BROTHER-related-like [Phalaenopsis equestris]